jgi:hypothetical protein
MPKYTMTGTFTINVYAEVNAENEAVAEDTFFDNVCFDVKSHNMAVCKVTNHECDNSEVNDIDEIAD